MLIHKLAPAPDFGQVWLWCALTSNLAVHQEADFARLRHEANWLMGLTVVERYFNKHVLILERLQFLHQLPNGLASNNPRGLRC